MLCRWPPGKVQPPAFLLNVSCRGRPAADYSAMTTLSMFVKTCSFWLASSTAVTTVRF